MPVDIGRGVLRIGPDYTELQSSLQTQLPGILQTAGQRALKVGATLTAALSAPIALIGKQAVDASLAFEQGLAGVAKTVGDVTEVYAPVIVALGEDLRELARETPIAATELLRIGEIAGQLGIDAENIPAFAEKVAQLAISTDLTTEAAAFSLARFANVLGTEAAGAIDGYADSLVALGNALPTTESQILSLSSRIAGAGAAVGISGEDILAFAAALSSVGVSAELGGTAISRVLVSIAQNVESGGEKLEKFAEVAGLTAEQFAEVWRESPTAALELFVNGLGRIQSEGQGIFDVLEDLDFSAVRVQQVLLKAAGASDKFTEALDIANNSTGALNVEFDKFASTTQSKLTVARNNITDAFIEIGNEGLPLVASLAEGVGKLFGQIAKIPGPFKTFLGFFVSLAGLVGPVLTMFGGILQGLATISLLRAQHKQAAIAAETQAAAEFKLATALEAVTVASGRATAATAVGSRAAVGRTAAAGSQVAGQLALFGTGLPRATTGLSGIAGAGGGAVGLAGLSVASAFRRTSVQRLGDRLRGVLTTGLKPSFAAVGKGLGASLGLGLLGSLVSTFEAEEDSLLRKLQKPVSGALGGASTGALVGSILGPKGIAIGAVAGGLIGAIRSLFSDATSDIEEVVAEETAPAVARGFQVGLDQEAIQLGLGDVDLSIPEIDTAALEESLKPVREKVHTALEDLAGVLNAFAETTMPSIFGRMFDPKKVEAAAKNLSFADIETTVAENLADLEEIDAVIEELVGRGLTGLAQQIVETGGPEALAAARSVRDQLLTDPESVFTLEKDILRLKGEVGEAFVDFLQFPETAGAVDFDVPIYERLIESGFLPPEERASLQERLNTAVNDNLTGLVEGLVPERTDLAIKFAASMGPLNTALTEALVLALGDIQVGAEGTSILGDQTASAIVTSLENADWEQLISAAVVEQGLEIKIPTNAVAEGFVVLPPDEVAAKGIQGALNDVWAELFPTQFDPWTGRTISIPQPPISTFQLLEDQIDFSALTQQVTTALGEWAGEGLAAAVAETDFQVGPSVLLQEKTNELIAQALETSVDVAEFEIPEIDLDIPISPQPVITQEWWGGLNFNIPPGVSWEITPELEVDEETTKEVGGNVLAGVLSGIEENYESFKTDSVNYLKALPAEMNTAIQADSPALLFKPVGQNIAEGIKTGLQSINVAGDFIEELQLLKTKAFQIGRDAGREFQRGIDFELSRVGPTYRTPAPPLAPPQKTINQELILNYPSTNDPVRDSNRILGLARTIELGSGVI